MNFEILIVTLKQKLREMAKIYSLSKLLLSHEYPFAKLH